ncbi:MAG: DUF4838 domain-containing protein [Kiritimatiellia bacterium]
MRNMQQVLAGLVALAMISHTCADVELVKDGKALADIVVETNAISSVQLAANDLQEFIEKMSGAKLEIVAEPKDQFKFHVYVGASDFTKKLGITFDDLKPEGFKIIAKDNYVVLIGRDEQRKPFPYSHHGEGLTNWWKFAGEKYGVPYHLPINSKVGFYPYDATATLYASSELLEQLGVRFYAPYEHGTVIPEKKTISVPEQTLSKAPAFPIRQFAYYAQWLDGSALKWIKRLKYGSSYLYGGAHATHTIIAPPEQKTEHPEYFAEVNGKRLGSMKGGVPRFCNASFRKTSINFLNKTFEAYPYLVAFDLMPPDGLGQIDERDAKIWHRPERGYNSQFSDYLWDYWLWAAKELKKVCPDKYLVGWSYSPYMEPPSGLDKLPDNVALYLCQNTFTSFLNKKNNDQLRRHWMAMLTSKKLFIYDYYLFYRDEQCPRYPVVFTQLLQEDMQALKDACEGKNIEIASELTKQGHRVACPGLTHLLHYWQGKLFWDPDLDRLKMLEEYYGLYFGPAKKEMKEFYEFAEEVWMRPESRSISAASGFLKEKDVERYFDILKRARDKAGQDSVHAKRIALIESEMQPLKKLFPNMKRSGPAFRGWVNNEPPAIDGDLAKPFWGGRDHYAWYAMKDMITGQEPDKNRTSVSFRMTPDNSNLVVGVICHESRMENISAKATENDAPDISSDDAIEILIDTPERSYFKITVNSNGAVLDESQDATIVARDTLPVLWNPGVKASVRREKYRWTAEILIPTKDFGTLGPTKVYPWGINVGRIRRAGGPAEYFALSPTGKPAFAELTKLGNIYFQ